MPHYDITMGNDIARYVHCDVTMSIDVAMCTYHAITMDNGIGVRASFIMYYYAQL